MKELILNKQKDKLNCDGFLQMAGDSMYPEINAGDVILYKNIPLISLINNRVRWGERYALSVDLGFNDKSIFIAYLRKSEKSDHILLASCNNHFEDMEICISKIQAIAIIKAVFRQFV